MGLADCAPSPISHPHFYTTLVDWSRAFGNVPVHLHADDAKWVRQPDPCIRFWQGERFELMNEITLVRGGGHFPGWAMLLWAAGAGGKGPLSEKAVRAVGARQNRIYQYAPSMAESTYARTIPRWSQGKPCDRLS